MEKSTSSAVPIDDDKSPSANGEEEVVMVEEKDCCFRPIHGCIMLTILAIVGLSVFLVKRNSSSSSPDNSAPPTPTPTPEFKKLIASDTDLLNFGASCSISDEVVLVGALYNDNGVAAYLFDLNGTEVNKLIPGNDEEKVLEWVFSMHEKIVLGTIYGSSNELQVFSRDGMYERTIKCDDCSSMGYSVATFDDIAVTSAWSNSTVKKNKLHVYNTTDGKLLKVLEADADSLYFTDIAVSDKAIVANAIVRNDAIGNARGKVAVYSISNSFEKITEIVGGNNNDIVATAGGKVVIASWKNAYLYKLDGTLVKELEEGRKGPNRGVDMTDEEIIIRSDDDVYIYSTLTGEFENKIERPWGISAFGRCVGASNNHYVIGAWVIEFSNGTAYLIEV